MVSCKVSDAFGGWYLANAKAIPSPYEKVDQAELEAKLVRPYFLSDTTILTYRCCCSQAQANQELEALREKVNQQDRDLEEAFATEEAPAIVSEAPKAAT